MCPMVHEKDPRLEIEEIRYLGETGDIIAYFAKPKVSGKLPGLVIVCEIWGLVPHIKDVARRAALEGFMALAPDPLSPLGGTPDNADEARSMMQKLDSEKNIKNFIAAVKYLKTHPQSTGRVGVTGFCWGGGVTNQLAVNSPDVQAAAPFYGMQPKPEDVPKIKASLLIHYAEDDERINAGIAVFEEALKKAGVDYQIHIYKGTKHAFFNDTGPRYNEEAAKLAWDRTVAFFKEKLKA
ncbi:MAG: dienelactone hydrolase family protein [Candidatus Bathyarchaeia archaeon]